MNFPDLRRSSFDKLKKKSRTSKTARLDKTSFVKVIFAKRVEKNGRTSLKIMTILIYNRISQDLLGRF